MSSKVYVGKGNPFARTNPFTGATTMVETRLTKVIEEHLGSAGRLIAMSKSRYAERYPKHTVFFNGCIYVVVDGKPVEVWWGDIDLTKDERKLRAIAKEGRCDFYVTPEDPFRMDFNKVTLETLEKDENVVKFGKGHASKRKAGTRSVL